MTMFLEGLRDAITFIANRDELVMDAAWRSLWISLLATFLAAIVGIAMGSVLARKNFFGRELLILALRVGMAMPTVLVGLLLYGLLSRRGALGEWELLYSPWAIVLGEFCLAVPIIGTLTHGAFSQLDPRLPETARMLGAGPLRRWRTYLSETRTDLLLAVLTAFARCFTELGIAMMIGGNIKFHTRTLATATALETSRGEFSRGIAMGLILLSMAVVVMLAVGLSENSQDKAR